MSSVAQSLTVFFFSSWFRFIVFVSLGFLQLRWSPEFLQFLQVSLGFFRSSCFSLAPWACKCLWKICMVPVAYLCSPAGSPGILKNTPHNEATGERKETKTPLHAQLRHGKPL